eukprot:1142226-Pelagomonas_calceolata.AAC.5
MATAGRGAVKCEAAEKVAVIKNRGWKRGGGAWLMRGCKRCLFFGVCVMGAFFGIVYGLHGMCPRGTSKAVLAYGQPDVDSCQQQESGWTDT